LQLIANLPIIVKGYTCETPDRWLQASDAVHHNLTLGSSEETDSQVELQHFLLGKLWPNGEVKYKIHSSFTPQDISELKKAFEEYHTKTCIRFVPWKTGAVDFVSVEIDLRDKTLCGRANVCKIGSYQYAKFGTNCRFMATMVHELSVPLS